MTSLRIVHLKLVRAEEHLDAFKREVAVWREIQPYEVIEDRESDAAALLITVRARQFPHARWSIVIGDFVHNLRSALDILANQLVKAAGNTPIEEGPASRRTQFPILNLRPSAKKGGVGRAEIWGGVSERAAMLVDRLQPYTWDNPLIHPLAILRELSNKDKHRGPNVVLSMIPWIESRVDTKDLEALIPQMHFGPVITEKTIRLPYEGRFMKDVDVHLRFTPFVLAGEAWENETGDAVALFSYLFEFVCQEVVGPFRRACFPHSEGLHLVHPFPGRRIRRIGPAPPDHPSEF